MSEPVHQAGVSRLDALFSRPGAAVGLAVLCNCLWGAAFPFIKLGYRLYDIASEDTPSILVFAGVRFLIAAIMVWLCGWALNRRMPQMPRGRVLAECCALGLWQTGLQYALYYSAAAVLTGALGSILNSTQSFLGVILAHFLCGGSDRMTLRKALGCLLGFGGVLLASVSGGEGGSLTGMLAMLAAAVVFAAAGPWNKSVTHRADSFSGLLPESGFRRRRPGAAGLCHGRPAAAPKPGRGAGAAVSRLHLRCRLCAVGAADEEQPGFPHCRVRTADPRGDGAAVGTAQRRDAAGLAVSGRPGAGLRGHLAGQSARCKVKGGPP